MRFTRKLFISALLTRLFGGAAAHAAEFEVLDRFSVDGYSVFRGSADIPGGSFAVGGATFTVKNGNVGIGTSAPAQRLEVSGGNINIPYEASRTNGYMLNLGNDVGYIWRNYAYADDGLFISQNWYRNDAGDANVIPNAGHSTEAVQFFRDGTIRFLTGGTNTAPSARMLIDSAGNIGIGTLTPGYPLHVAGNIYASNGVIATTLWPGDSIRKISAASPLYFRNSAGTPEMTLDGSGNLGIGNSNPAHKLQVSGGIYAQGYDLVDSNYFDLAGSQTNFYPVVFADNSWDSGGLAMLQITRPNGYTDPGYTNNGNAFRTVEADFKWHSSAWGFGSAFVDARIMQSGDLIADYELDPYSRLLIVYLRGANRYYYKSSGSLVVVSDYSAACPKNVGNYPLSKGCLTSISAKAANNNYWSSNGEFGGSLIVDGNVGVGITNPTSKLAVSGLPGSSGSGGLYVCVDSNGNFYKKSSCP